MALSQDKKVEWLYAHFQAVSAAGDRLLLTFGVLFVSTLAVWRSHANQVELPFMDVSVGREVLLGSLILSAVATVVAFFGHYDKGEATLDALAATLGCGYEELEFVDTHPTVIDFMQYRRPAVALTRRWISRLCVSLLYPVVLLGSLLLPTGVTAHELFMADMTAMDVLPFALSIPLFVAAWHRGSEYFNRRWKTFRATESARKTPPAAV